MERASASAAAAVRVICGTFEDLVAIGLRELLGRDPSVELIAHDVPLERLPAAIDEHAPNVVIVNYGSLVTPAAVQQLRRLEPETRVVVLANRPTAAECNQLLSFGVTACISKETQARDIVNAVHLASRGLHLLPRTIAAAERLDAGSPDRLTAREADVLELLQQGRTNGQIAHALSISIETVRTHARNIYRKLGVASRRDLVDAARRERQLVEPVVLDSLSPVE